VRCWCILLPFGLFYDNLALLWPFGRLYVYLVDFFLYWFVVPRKIWQPWRGRLFKFPPYGRRQKMGQKIDWEEIHLSRLHQSSSVGRKDMKVCCAISRKKMPQKAKKYGTDFKSSTVLQPGWPNRLKYGPTHFVKLIHNLNRGKSSSKNLCYLCNFPKTALRQKTAKRRKFVQSGHPGHSFLGFWSRGDIFATFVVELLLSKT
jgi:hypothetical protein